MSKLNSVFTNLTVGRNKVVVELKLIMIIVEFFFGIFDEFSDWYYFFEMKSNN